MNSRIDPSSTVDGVDDSSTFTQNGVGVSLVPTDTSNIFFDSSFRPFSKNSFWNKKVDSNAKFADVQDAIFNITDEIDVSVGLDIVTLVYSDKTKPLVDFRLSKGWGYPDRAKSRGEVLFREHLSSDALTGVRLPKNGNGIYMIVDPETGLSTQGLGAWREPGGEVTTFFDDIKLHNRDVINSYGFFGPRGSNLHALGGAIMEGEINTGIDHAIGIAMTSLALSKAQNYVWPALSADDYASDPDSGYRGPNKNLAMGSLLALPSNVDIDQLKLKTPQGRIMAKNAQEYGWYVVDNSARQFLQLAIERKAAYNDLGLSFKENGISPQVDSGKFNYEFFLEDMMNILKQMQAVVNNEPDFVHNNAPVIQTKEKISVNLGSSVDIQLKISDADNDYVVLEGDVPKLGIIETVDRYKNIYKYTPKASGVDVINIKAFDGQEYSTKKIVVEINE